ncbi:ATPase involved in DNA repair [Methanosarcina siciliae C2J]|uniref:ATPase involved in DNA repair n=1 Tax=Methanosarcina siciliae C2J TaxID=1434118 RepID=A0A0E3PP43_9EURY|nr:AAA family ATPase [Methanosarcina siciliae]AKB36993.1 ATPase involved in DNA repair [Methanosarcina siciliae C2J]
MVSCWDWVGAKWWKFDFHTHTPASDDYGKGSDQRELRMISPKDWLLNYMKAEIDCVAVTDHNSGAWIDPLKQALSELEAENPPEFRPICLFPGVELTMQGNIHILALFPCEKTTSDIDNLLGAVKFRGTKGSSDACSECSAIEVLDEIQKENGIAIPAHVDEENGLFVFHGTTLEQVLDHKGIIAMEIKSLSYRKPQTYIDKKLNWAEVLGTDAHHPTGSSGLFYPGSHFTWVKMSEPSFDGLKLALIDGNISIKRSDSFSGNPNIHGLLAIESITIDNGRFIGRPTSFICRFNPWLNTIIGGRGTGKSTVIEFLRIALDRKEELPKSLEKDFNKYGEIPKSRQDEGLLIGESAFTVCFRKNGGRFLIKWSISDKCHIIEEETSPGEWVLSEGDIKQRFPVRIYSQKQIFELAKNPQALLKIIDDASDVSFRDWKFEWDELISKYLSIKAQIREIETGLHEESSIHGQLDDIKRKLDVFENAGHANILKCYQLRQDQEKAIETWENSWDNIAEQVKDLAEELEPSEVISHYLSLKRSEDQELIDETSSIIDKFQEFQEELLHIATRIDDTWKAWIDRKRSLMIIEKITSANRDYNDLLCKLSEVGTSDPAAYGPLVKQRQELEQKLENFTKKRVFLMQLQQKASECLIRVHEHREKITQLREDFLNKTLEGNSYVQISVIPYGNKDAVEGEFRDLINRSIGGFDKDIGSIDGDEGYLSLLYRDNGQTMEKRLENLKTSISLIFDGNIEAVESAKDQRFVSHIQKLTPEQIDRLQCWYPEDSLYVKYSLKNSGKFKPVEQGSPGQKTAALLAFVLSYGDEPLILDQPEDDLDNSLIYDLIVTELREIKQSRQVIVVTHNANIVVNGDAENVIALDISSSSGTTKVITQDCLQKPSIRDEICHVMEGGKVAFDQRYKRITAGK